MDNQGHVSKSTIIQTVLMNQQVLPSVHRGDRWTVFLSRSLVSGSQTFAIAKREWGRPRASCACTVRVSGVFKCDILATPFFLLLFPERNSVNRILSASVE